MPIEQSKLQLKDLYKIGFALRNAKKTNPIKGFPSILKLVINIAPAGIATPIFVAISVNNGAVDVQTYNPNQTKLYLKLILLVYYHYVWQLNLEPYMELPINPQLVIPYYQEVP